MEDWETPWMRQYGESKTTRIMMATVPHVTSGSGIRKFQTDGFLFDRVYKPVTAEDTVLHISVSILHCIKIDRWWWCYAHNWYMLIVTEHKLLPLVLVSLACITVSLFIIRASWIRAESFCSESVYSCAEVRSVLCRCGVEWNRTE